MNWSAAPAEIALPPGEVHVWRVPLLRQPEEIMALRALLNPDEAARAARYRFDRDRGAFVVRRGILRLVLGRYLEQWPFRQEFPLTPYGQPRMPDGPDGADIRFSVSHSAGVALLAFARGREIGVDIEAIRPEVDCLGVAQNFFSKLEQETLRAVPGHQQRAAFFACWSRKEAYIKARGMGLSIPLDQFDVTLAPADPARLLATRDPADSTDRWSMHRLDPAPHFAAALVMEGHDVPILRWDWP